MKKFAKDHFPDAKSDLFACFIERGYTLAKDDGHNAMVTMQSWMFLSSFEKMRERMLREKTITTMAHLGAASFRRCISARLFRRLRSCSRTVTSQDYKPVVLSTLGRRRGSEKRAGVLDERREAIRCDVAQDEFEKIPGSPVAYWVSDAVRRAVFEAATHSGEIRDATSRAWQPATTIDFFGVGMRSTYRKIGFGCSRSTSRKRSRKWFPYNKGGDFRKWYGNNEYRRQLGERRRRAQTSERSRQSAVASATNLTTFRDRLTWSDDYVRSVSLFGTIRHGFMFDVDGLMLLSLTTPIEACLLGFLNSQCRSDVA